MSDKKEIREVFTFRMLPSLRKKARAAAKKVGKSFSAWLEEAAAEKIEAAKK